MPYGAIKRADNGTAKQVGVPIFCQRPPADEQTIIPGQMAIHGELGLFALSLEWLLRMRHNPFYAHPEAGAIDLTMKHKAPRARSD
jgi:hypothetical protein